MNYDDLVELKILITQLDNIEDDLIKNDDDDSLWDSQFDALQKVLDEVRSLTKD